MYFKNSFFGSHLFSATPRLRVKTESDLHYHNPTRERGIPLVLTYSNQEFSPQRHKDTEILRIHFLDHNSSPRLRVSA